MPLQYNKKNIPIAKMLRKNATPQEDQLWYRFLADYEVRFQRQKAVGNYIADFYCYKAKLIIELDGSQHYTDEGKRQDAYRTEVLEGFDLKVIRIPNNAVDNNFRGVCDYIDNIVKEELAKVSQEK